MAKQSAPPARIDRDRHGPAARLRGLLERILHGGLGAAGALLLPRVWSVVLQWTLAATGGAALVTSYVSTTTRGSAAVSLVAITLGPVLGYRKGALATTSGRALVSAALLTMGALAFVLTLCFEASVGLGLRLGLFTSIFATATVLQGAAIVAWPVWQARGLYARLLLIMAAGLCASLALALVHESRLAAVTVGLSGTVPCVAMMRRTSWKRAVRYALGVARRAVPLSAMGAATALVYPMCLERGAKLLGETAVGHQVLFFSVAAALNIVSQAISVRAITLGHRLPAAGSNVTRWLPVGVALAALSAVIWMVFRWRLAATGAPPLPTAMVVIAASFILSDPISVYFSPPAERRFLALGSSAAALVVTFALLSWPAAILTRIGVCGPPAVIAALRLPFVRDPLLRRYARVAFVVLAIGFVVSAASP